MIATELRLKDVAEALSGQAAHLLGAPTYVVDRDHRVVAASRPGWVGRFVRGNAREQSLEVQVEIAGEEGWVVVGPPLDGGSVPAHLAQALVNLLVDQAAIVGTLPHGAELKNKIIHDLLHGPGENEATLVRQARLLGMDIGPPRAVILIDAGRYIFDGETEDRGRDDIARRGQTVIDEIVSFFQLPNDTICAYIGDGEVAVLKASDTRNLRHWADAEDVANSSSWANLAALKRAGRALLARLQSETGVPLSIGIGRYHRGAGGLARSYADARAALGLGQRLSAADRVHSLDTLGVAAFVGVSDERTKMELAKHLLSPLDADPELITSLEVYFREDCHPSRAAESLGLHRNSLNYRLEKVALITGLDPRVFDQAVQIRLALVLRSLETEAAAQE
ncbi:MAG: helix-turn-helix domain-containing protein [Trueperaceae bacterium]